MATRAEFIEAARWYARVKGRKGKLGAPWMHQGRDENGMDCAGLVIATAWDTGISRFDITGYPKRPDEPGQFVRHFLEAGCVLKPHAELRPGDVIITRLEKYPFHCGIYTGGPGDGRLIHAYARSPHRRVVEMGFYGELRRGWTHCLQVPGLSD